MRKNTKKSVSVTSDTVITVDADLVTEKRVALDASDKPVIRTALDASDLNANTYSFAGIEIDYALESSLEEVETEEAQPEFIDPMSVHGSLPVKLAYVFENMELDTNRIYLASDASVEAANRANDRSGPRVPVIIRCATTGAELHTVYPSKGNEARKVTVVSGNRPVRQTTVRQTGPSAEERELQQWIADYNAAVKENNRRDAAWDAMIDQAEKDNAKFDRQRDKAIREEAARIAKAMKKNRNMPEEGTDNFEIFKLFSEEHGLTCMEGNHAMNFLKNVNNSNYGWKQKGKEFTGVAAYNKVLIGKYRMCAIAYAKTGLMDKSMKEAMRLVDREYDNDGSLIIPDGWYLIQA